MPLPSSDRPRSGRIGPGHADANTASPGGPAVRPSAAGGHVAPAGHGGTGFSDARLTTAASRLDDGLGALGISLPAEAGERLVRYVGLMMRWGRRFNLTAVLDPLDIVSTHVLDSLAALAALEARFGELHGRVVDVGSGAGLPGIPWVIARPGLVVHSVEPVGKKASFQIQCRSELRLGNLQVHGRRIEQLAPDALGGAPEWIVCRAFSSLEDFVRAGHHLVGPTTRLVAMKGARWEAEADAYAGAGQPPVRPGGAQIVITDRLPVRVPTLDAVRALVVLTTAAAADVAPQADR